MKNREHSSSPFAELPNGATENLLWQKTCQAAASLLVMLVYLLCVPSEARGNEEFQLTPVRDNVWRFTAGAYHSVVMVSDKEIIITDPISESAASWLQTELKKRFGLPVSYMIYSHNHPDHTYGGEVFAATGTRIIGHRLAREDLQHTRAQTALPDLVFDDQLTLYSGKNRVHLQYHGSNNGRGSISMRFEPAGVMHVVDWIVLGRLPYKNLPGYDIEGMIHSTREVLKEDFRVFVGGHSRNGSKQDVADYLAYLEALYDGVRDGMLAGKSLAELQQQLTLPAYRQLKMYPEWRVLNIEGVYKTLKDQSYLLMRPEIRSAGESH